MTDDQSLGRLADSIDALVGRMDRQTVALEDATGAMRRHRWSTRAALAALALAVAVLVVLGVQEVGARAERDRAACERGNGIREAVVRAAAVAVETTALELAGADETAQAEAARIAGLAGDAVARDPDLRLRDCG